MTAAQDQGTWTMTDAEFKAELHEEFKRGFRSGHAAGRSGVILTLDALDMLIEQEGLSYRQARDLIDRMREAGPSRG